MKTKFVISEQFRGCRLDKALAMMFEDHSRSTLQSWIDEGRIYVNEQQPSRRLLVVGGERVSIDFPQPKSHAWTSENIPLDILYEDEQLLVVNKPAGLVVHPGAGNSSGTLLNGLLHHCAELAQLPRAGIVHRLDKNTSGLLVVAKTEVSRLRLVKQFKKRTVGREYLAIVIGRLISGGTITQAIGRNRYDRRKMTVGHGKPAVSHYRIVSRYREHTLLRVTLDTGRTHQIRVHFQYAGFPILGDPDYGRRSTIPKGASQELIAALAGFRRQALHAETLSIDHPVSGQRQRWHQFIPPDFRELIIALKGDVVRNP